MYGEEHKRQHLGRTKCYTFRMGRTSRRQYRYGDCVRSDGRTGSRVGVVEDGNRHHVAVVPSNDMAGDKDVATTWEAGNVFIKFVRLEPRSVVGESVLKTVQRGGIRLTG
jgi:hypothetical protein